MRLGVETSSGNCYLEVKATLSADSNSVKLVLANFSARAGSRALDPYGVEDCVPCGVTSGPWDFH